MAALPLLCAARGTSLSHNVLDAAIATAEADHKKKESAGEAADQAVTDAAVGMARAAFKQKEAMANAAYRKEEKANKAAIKQAAKALAIAKAELELREAQLEEPAAGAGERAPE